MVCGARGAGIQREILGSIMLLYCPILSCPIPTPTPTLPLLTSFLKVCPSQGLVLEAVREESEHSGCRPEDFRICRIKDGQSLVGALVCQISLLESVCQGLAAVSGEAPDSRAKLRTLQGYAWQPLAGVDCSEGRRLLPHLVPWRAHSPHPWGSATGVWGCAGKLGIRFFLLLHLFLL